MSPKVTAIVLAGGKGSRMHSDTPKQYLPLLGKPVLFYSLSAFEQSEAEEIILVTAAGEETYCKKEIIDKYGFKKVKAVVTGGAERYHSVYAGLLAADGADYVLIHDGARPMISVPVINASINKVKETGACVAGMPVKDTIQLADEGGRITETPNRAHTWIAQTPQCFSYETALSSYNKAIACGDTTITDDAMVVRKYAGAEVYLLEGGYENIKITTANPNPVPNALAIESPKLKAWSVLPCATPNTAQFVVINGK